MLSQTTENYDAIELQNRLSGTRATDSCQKKKKKAKQGNIEQTQPPSYIVDNLFY